MIHLPWTRLKPKIISRAPTLAEFAQTDHLCEDCGTAMKPAWRQRVSGKFLAIFCPNCGHITGLAIDEVIQEGATR